MRSLLSPSRLVPASLALLALAAPALAQSARVPPLRQRGRVALEGPRRVWQPLSLTLVASAPTDELAHAPGENPFLDRRLDVVFTHESSGAERRVPGYYAADGVAADTGATGGDRWRARFAPDLAGAWTWRVEFRRGALLAVDRTRAGAPADALDGESGRFEIEPADPAAPGLLAKGALRHVGEPFFRFAETGEPYLKAGFGSPENFLAYFEFDGTAGSGESPCLAGPDFLHRYDAHEADFVADAVGLAHVWGAPARGQRILGALDYLASEGVNSLYFITDTWLADGSDVWPWTTPGDKRHFDVSKLEQWERVFAHMTARGLQLQFVLEEHENDQIPVSGGGLGHALTLERRLYYREMVARFAHHPALLWVIGDESDYYDEVEAMQAMALELRALDPYDHPIAFHSKHPCFGGGCPDPQPSVQDQYAPYADFEAFEASVFQTSPGSYNTVTAGLRAQHAGGREWAHHGDEQSLNATAPNLDANRMRALWGNLMGGGAGIAWYSGNSAQNQYPPGESYCDYFDLSLEDFRTFEAYLEQTAAAVALFHAHLPFTEMSSANALATPSGSTDYVLARPGAPGAPAVYAVYRGTGTAAALSIGEGAHSVDWFDPRTGAGPTADAPVEGPGAVVLTPPSAGPDWLAIVRQL